MKNINGANIIILRNDTQGGIYLGSISSIISQQTLLSNNIKAVISLCKFQRNIQFQNKQIHHLLISIQDNEQQDIDDYFPITYKFIQQERKRTNVLIHCLAGISRSATILISYLMKKYQINYNQAKQLVKQKRNIIQPNIGFQKQLKDYEGKLFPKL